MLIPVACREIWYLSVFRFLNLIDSVLLIFFKPDYIGDGLVYTDRVTFCYYRAPRLLASHPFISLCQNKYMV